MKFKKGILTICTLIVFSFIIIGCENTKNVKDVKSQDNYSLELKNGTRFFKSEVEPKSDAEKVILDCLKVEISDEYDRFKDIYIDSNTFNYYPESYKKNFKDGLFTEEITVHSLNKLNEDVYTNKSSGLKYYPYMDRLKEYNPKEFEIFEINYTNKLTDKYNKIAQWGSGNWTIYYVVVKEKDDSGWRIFDIYGQM